MGSLLKTKNKKLKANLQGQVLIAVVIFFLGTTLALILGFAEPVLRSIWSAGDAKLSSQSYYAAESLAEDIAYRLIVGKQTASTESLAVGSSTATSTLTISSGLQTIITTGTQNTIERAVKIALQTGTGASFHYAMQAGQGGFSLNNSSSITGNVYSAGPVIGSSGNLIGGDAVSSGASGLIYGIHATGTVYADIIGNAAQGTTIDKDAYYNTTLTNTTVSGATHSGSADQPPASFPISDSEITGWENTAASGGTISTCDGSGNYVINSTTTLGPVKILCNLVIKNSSVVTLEGMVWVAGNITVENSAIVKIDPSFGASSLAIIADNLANESGSGVITLQDSSQYFGSGTSGSFLFVISQNNSVQGGGSTTAITMGNSSNGSLILYAIHGEIALTNSIKLKETTGYKITMQNSANITYDTGLPSVLFSAGPSGGYSIINWKEQFP